MRYAIAVLVLLGWAGADPNAEGDAAARGKKVFHDTQDLQYPSCAHCHNVVPEAEEAGKAAHLPPGGTLWGAAVREGWRNMNTFADVGEASQYCAKTWQQRRGGLRAEALADLVAYLRTIAPEGPLPKRKVEKKPKLLEDLDGGDAEQGEALAARHCTGCHNDKDDALSFPFQPARKEKNLVARKVRGYDEKNQFKPQGGTMSYYTTDRLPDEALRHIVAWLGR